MKKLAIFLPLVVTASVHAAQCRVDIKNEVRLDGEVLEIHQTNGDKAVVDASNNLYIHGEKIELNGDQQAAIEEYRENLNAYLPRAKQVAEESLALANDIIDDIAVSLDAPNAFDNVKTAVKDFFTDVESRYYKDGDLILPADSFASMTESWQDDFQRAQEIFNKEFISSAFDAMSSKMKQEGGLNLSAMSQSMTELKQKVQERLQQHSKEIEQQTQDFCDSLDDMAVQEQDLLKKIPELKNYQVFTI
ncbi:YggN family protein [Vibrio vulnificus]|uniref:YggN family protein n=1 Tax=Vibrio vulnificus TaxID=672 RepID=UPI0009B6009A|nr:YggN family protein [Vibrio vulnificus]AUL96424.1 Methyl-accepting chemotaxis protein [Vibrio vulnificus]EGQ8076617.1 YggN family protein [Vibrio vulnificus]EHH0792687.1 YggN family protein [Vibrio vulnificus]EHK9051882.1 YggN family protein [Vibrio vulnificus]EHU4928108.1 YggN family protein [Vibrio vulnificus]